MDCVQKHLRKIRLNTIQEHTYTHSNIKKKFDIYIDKRAAKIVICKKYKRKPKLKSYQYWID